MNIAVGVYMAAFLMVAPLYFAMLSRLHRILRNEYPQTYEELGSPTFFANNSLKNGWLTLRFVMTRQCHELGDARISRTCQILRVCLVAIAVPLVVISAFGVFPFLA